MFQKMKDFVVGLFSKKSEPKSSTPSIAHRWTKDEERRLSSFVKAGFTKDEMAFHIGRSVSSINYKLSQMYSSSSSKVLKNYTLRGRSTKSSKRAK